MTMLASLTSETKSNFKKLNEAVIMNSKNLQAQTTTSVSIVQYGKHESENETLGDNQSTLRTPINDNQGIKLSYDQWDQGQRDRILKILEEEG